MRGIVLGKPNIEELKRQGYACVDMHMHSCYSDGAASIDEIICKARKSGFGISITDHNEIAGSLEAFEKRKGAEIVIPGIEVKSVELIDILFYFYNIADMERFYKKEVLPKKKRFLHVSKTTLKFREIFQLSKKYRCLACAAHPFGYSMRTTIGEVFEKNKEVFSMFGTFEALNGGNSRKQNLKAVEYIEKNGKAFMGGTDGHSIYPIGNVLTCSKAKSIAEFLDNIKSKKNFVIGTETRFRKLGEYFGYGKNKIMNLVSR